MWLGPTVEALYALSSSLEEGVGLVIIGACSFSTCPLPVVFQVSSPAKIIFVGINVLLSVSIFLDFHALGHRAKSFRRLMQFMPVRMGSSTSSNAWTSFFDDSTLTL
jgi:hypothetical protein